MLRRKILCSTALAGIVLAAPVHAQSVQVHAQAGAQAAQDQTDAEIEAEARKQGEILVIADRIKGQVDAPEKPIETLDEKDIAAYGATSLTDLLAALSPQTGSGRGRGRGGMPIMLVNGMRISSFREMRNFPPEAIRRIEILPEEVALRYGYPPNARVVNMILKNEFAAKTVELEYKQPDRGGTSTQQVEASLFKVSGPRRFNLTGSWDQTSPLTEAERGVVQAAGSVPSVTGDPDPANARTLISRGSDATVNATWTTGFGPKGLDGALTLNGTATRSDSHGLSGLNTVLLTAPGGTTATRTFGDPLRRDNRTDTLQAGATLNKPLGNWQLTATLDAGHVTSDTTIDRRANSAALVSAASAGTLSITGPLPAQPAAGSDLSRSVNDSVTSLVTLVGRPAHLPAGDVALTVKGGFAWTGIASDDTRSTAGHTVLHRGDLSGGINLALPLTSRRENFLAGAGDISLNFSAGIDRLSDFGTLVDWTAGVTWGLTEKLGFQASYIVNEAAPGLSSLGNPLAVTFNVPVYDFTRGETALVTITSGGNPALLKERDRDLKLALNWQVPFLKNSNLIAEYFRNNSDNVTASFPVLTPAIEAAFPGRVTRDSTGRLVAIDQRAVTFANEKASRLRWGLNFGGTIGKASPMQQAMQQQMGRRGGGGGPPGGGRMGGGGGPPMMMGMGQGGQGRWNIALFHTVQFTNRVLVSPSGPTLDLLNGDALSAGGVARHSLEVEGGAFYHGFGLRVNGTVTGATHVNGTGAPGSSDLRFGSLAKFNLRMFVDLGQQKGLTRKSKFWKGARLMVYVNNLFDSRQKVTDQNGVVPVSYQPDLIDPQGRVLGIELRKQF